MCILPVVNETSYYIVYQIHISKIFASFSSECDFSGPNNNNNKIRGDEANGKSNQRIKNRACLRVNIFPNNSVSVSVFINAFQFILAMHENNNRSLIQSYYTNKKRHPMDDYCSLLFCEYAVNSTSIRLTPQTENAQALHNRCANSASTEVIQLDILPYMHNFDEENARTYKTINYWC